VLLSQQLLPAIRHDLWRVQQTVPQCTGHAIFLHKYISQGSVAARLRYDALGSLMIALFIANFLETVAMRKRLKSVSIW